MRKANFNFFHLKNFLKTLEGIKTCQDDALVQIWILKIIASTLSKSCFQILAHFYDFGSIFGEEENFEKMQKFYFDIYIKLAPWDILMHLWKCFEVFFTSLRSRLLTFEKIIILPQFAWILGGFWGRMSRFEVVWSKLNVLESEFSPIITFLLLLHAHFWFFGYNKGFWRTLRCL